MNSIESQRTGIHGNQFGLQSMIWFMVGAGLLFACIAQPVRVIAQQDGGLLGLGIGLAVLLSAVTFAMGIVSLARFSSLDRRPHRNPRW